MHIYFVTRFLSNRDMHCSVAYILVVLQWSVS